MGDEENLPDARALRSRRRGATRFILVAADQLLDQVRLPVQRVVWSRGFSERPKPRKSGARTACSVSPLEQQTPVVGARRKAVQEEE